MLFHYGNCKNELYDLNLLKLSLEKKIHELEVHNAELMKQVQEGKALYDYQVGVLEREIAGRKCLCDTMDKEIANLNEIISRKDTEIKELKGNSLVDLTEDPKGYPKKKAKKK